jgi:uncharacterized protein YxeA
LEFSVDGPFEKKQKKRGLAAIVSIDLNGKRQLDNPLFQKEGDESEVRFSQNVEIQPGETVKVEIEGSSSI